MYIKLHQLWVYDLNFPLKYASKEIRCKQLMINFKIIYILELFCLKHCTCTEEEVQVTNILKQLIDNIHNVQLNNLYVKIT